MHSLEGLLKYTKDQDREAFLELVDMIMKYSDDKVLAQEAVGSSIEINLSELESLVKPEKFEFPDYEVGVVGVEENE
jgi:hypothetical protein